MNKSLKRLFGYLAVAAILFTFRHFMGFELAVLLGVAFINVDIKEDK